MRVKNVFRAIEGELLRLSEVPHPNNNGSCTFDGINVSGRDVEILVSYCEVEGGFTKPVNKGPYYDPNFKNYLCERIDFSHALKIKWPPLIDAIRNLGIEI
jgi:hypothetical protein